MAITEKRELKKELQRCKRNIARAEKMLNDIECDQPNNYNLKATLNTTLIGFECKHQEIELLLKG